MKLIKKIKKALGLELKTSNSMSNWAKRECELAIKQHMEHGDEYGAMCYKSAYKAYQALMEDGHSGCSISMTKNILVRLIEGKPCLPIEDTPDIWHFAFDRESNGAKVYQCSRMSSLFKEVYPDGTTTYNDVNRIVSIDTNGHTWHSGQVDEIVDKMYPITFPYTPGEAIKVYIEDFLVDKKNGDYDTRAIFYLIKDGQTIEIDRFFTTGENGEWVEITEKEYRKLKGRRIDK